MPLSWNEIKSRAVAFTNEWKDEVSEDAEAKSFWDDFFNVFGISRRRVATFEHAVSSPSPLERAGVRSGYIDLLWKGTILIEHKSRGKDLIKAYQQAKDYFPGLKEKELPRYILVSDFERFNLYDLEKNTSHEFRLTDFVNHVHLFGFIAGYEKRTYKEQDPVNIEAAVLMGKLHDKLKAIGYTGHALELYLVRLLFCLFADDINIFEKGILQDYIDLRTTEDGSDLANHIAQLFEVLNSPKDKRFKNLDENLAAFPYVNGKLFEEHLPIASFDSEMRKLLLECCLLDWGKISPAIFGSLFQSVMNPVERRALGAHYTSEKNILKLIKPLFLDGLWKEFESSKTSKNKLAEFHKKISELKFLDPACGCGNFLVITYRELRLLEIEILRTIYKNQLSTSIESIVWLDVDMMYGIEYEEFPARIAEVAMWLMDHQMNMAISAEFGQYFIRLPLKKAATIVNGNALLIDWQGLLNPINIIDVYAKHTNIYLAEEQKQDYKTVNVKTESFEVHKGEIPETKPIVKFDYIMGNPPFIGKSLQNPQQKQDMERVFIGVKGTGVLDYVTSWYLKAAQIIQNSKTKAAFVSTNSITQGEQVGVLWNLLFNKYNIKIHFAHRTFSWSNEAKGNAAVHVVIIGFANFDTTNKVIYEYNEIKGEPHEVKVKNINPYLVDGKDFALLSRTKPICNVPEISFGNMPNDGGYLLIEDKDVEEYKHAEELSAKYIKPFIGAHEFLNAEKKWCLWFSENLDPNDLQNMPNTYERLNAIKVIRLKSKRETTKSLALFPGLFGEIRQPKTNYILIPRVSSENRKIIPMSIFSPDNIVGDTCLCIPNATFYHLGILQSSMHMAWTKYTCGRLKSDYRYSNNLVYNNFPWPENPTDKQIKAIENAAQKILNVRKEFPKSSLADLYDPLTMPPILVKAHLELDKLVDA